MKVNKVGFWITLVLTLVFLAAGVVFALLKPAATPIVVSKDLRAWSSGYSIVLDGKLKNDTDKELTITYIEIEVTTTGATHVLMLKNTDVGEDPEDFILAPGEEFDLAGYGVDSYDTARTLTTCKVKVDGVMYTVYDSMPAFTVAAIAMFIFAVIFAIITVTALVQNNKQKKRYAEMEATLANMEGDGILLGGTYSQKGENGKNAAKTAASVTAGALSAAFLGVGVYKIYGGNAVREYIITDNGVYIGVPSKQPINFAQMNFIQKGKFGDCEVTTKKQDVILFNKTTTETLRFETKNSKTNPEQLAARLQSLIDYVPEPVAPEAETAQTAEDPFKDL